MELTLHSHRHVPNSHGLVSTRPRRSANKTETKLRTEIWASALFFFLASCKSFGEFSELSMTSPKDHSLGTYGDWLWSPSLHLQGRYCHTGWLPALDPRDSIVKATFTDGSILGQLVKYSSRKSVVTAKVS